ncbi:SIS domain-containing protein [Mollicutes bacterium LVI A0039]|nr:SIS domain-containing protein [Mollicutes bacterium LVI A0039]
MDKLLDSITELLFETGSSQEQMLLLYLEKNCMDLPNQSLAKVADNNFCSTTSVTRLIKKLGYSSFKELQLSLSISAQNEKMASCDLICMRFIKQLKQANCIYIYGKGASQITSLYLFRQLIKHGYDASYIDEQDLLYSLHNKTILCVSNSGETSTVYKVMSDIKEINNCQILAITKHDSTLDNIADHSIVHNQSIYGRREEQQHLLSIANELIARL